jgi:hypothetical protein
MYGTNGRLKKEPNLDWAAGNDLFGDREFNNVARGMDGLTDQFDEMGLNDREKGRHHRYGHGHHAHGHGQSHGQRPDGRRQRYAHRIKTSPADVVSAFLY